MKKITFLIVFISFIYACSTAKYAQEATNRGNYEEAIELSIKKLASNKTKKRNQPHITILKNAFEKATSRDLSRIKFLKKDRNPENLEEILDFQHVLPIYVLIIKYRLLLKTPLLYNY